MTSVDITKDKKLTFKEWCDLIGVNRVIFAPEDGVMSFQEWAKAASLSERTAKDIIERGQGPKIVQLSAGRIGIRVCDHRAWLAARTRKTAA
jgi:hypothetical protein